MGLGMGGPSKPFLTDIFLPSFEKRLHDISSQTFPYRRYVGNILVFIESDYFITILHYFRSAQLRVSDSPEGEITSKT